MNLNELLFSSLTRLGIQMTDLVQPRRILQNDELSNPESIYRIIPCPQNCDLPLLYLILLCSSCKPLLLLVWSFCRWSVAPDSSHSKFGCGFLLLSHSPPPANSNCKSSSHPSLRSYPSLRRRSSTATNCLPLRLHLAPFIINSLKI